MRRIVGLAVFITVAVIIFGCASDIILEEEAPLKGVYKGRYTVTDLTQDIEYEQVVRWTFEDVAFHMDIDVDDPIAEKLDCMCNYDGRYELVEKVRLRVTERPVPPGNIGSLSCSACNDIHDPTGSYDRVTVQDTLKLTGVDSDGKFRRDIVLVRLTE
ncbi:MAG: hypothetical protein ACE5K8_07035 [Candidatus Zixiibacteriota bacterium]